MTAPRLVPLSFQGDPLADAVDAFVAQLVADTSYWSGATAEYGVGPLSTVPPQHVAEPAPASLTDAQVQAWLTSKIMAGAVPRPNENTIYAIFYPQGTSVTLGGGTLCQDSAGVFNGYHSDYVLIGS